MNDCPNAEIRDQLPDLIHDRLSVNARTMVLAHIDGCVDCREEVALLRSVHSVLIARQPRVDITYVVGALPKPPVLTQRTAAVAPIARPRRTWADWRIAAAVTFLAVGGASVAIANRDRQGVQPSIADTPTAIVPAAVAPLASSETASDAASGLHMAGRLTDLSDEELQSLINDIEQMQAVPVADPEPVLKVDSRITLPEDSGL